MTGGDADLPSRTTPLAVAIGLVERGGAFLIRQRPEGQSMAGLWEFPGGKVEPGETAAEAAARECQEEVGLPIAVGRLVRRIVHDYPRGPVDLAYFLARLADPGAEPDPATGFRWVRREDLPAYTFPPANEPLIALLAADGSTSEE